MVLRHTFAVILYSALVLSAQARHLQPYKHEAVNIQRRRVGAPIQPTPTPSVASIIPRQEIFTYITPSPGASAIPVTEESQLVTSYVPKFTLCELPPQAIYPVTALPATIATNAPWRNYSISYAPESGTCITIYSQTETMVCATTLTGLVQKYTVTNCAQDITFSTEYGFVLAIPTAVNNVTGVPYANATVPAVTPMPTVQRLTTYYLAPWQAITAGTAPKEVLLKVCAQYANGTAECVRQYEVWHTSFVTQVATTSTSVNISTTIHGTSQVIVETFVANVTEQITTFRLTTDMELEYSTEVETTSREPVTPTTAATSYMTITVENAPSATLSGGCSTITSTRTSTIHRTTTVYVGTTTMPLPSPAAPSENTTALPTPTESVDWVSKLGIPPAEPKQ